MKEIVPYSNKNLTKDVREVLSVDEIPEYLSKEEINLILEQAKEHARDWLFMFCLWTTGVRVSEAIAIRKGDINFQDRYVEINWLKKRKKLRRIIPIHKDLAYNLSVYVGSLNQDDLLFPISRQRAFQIIKKYVSETNIKKKVSPHIFRHSFAVYFLKQRKNLVALKKLLGHANIQTTMIYLNIVKSDLRQEIDGLEF